MDFAEVLICSYPTYWQPPDGLFSLGKGQEMLISEKHSVFFFSFSEEGMLFLFVAMAELSMQT